MSIKLFLFTLLSFFNTFTSSRPHNPQAKAIKNAGITLSPGTYTFTNVKTGQKLKYNPAGNHIFPASVNPGTALNLVKHPSANYMRLGFGNKAKCLSSAWGGSFDNAAVAYACNVGPGAQKSSTLEKTKQWWILVPTNARLGKRSDISATAEEDEFNSTISMIEEESTTSSLEKRKSRGRGRGKKHPSRSSGTFYIIPVDHLNDMATRALTGETIQSRGIRSTRLDKLQSGNTAQQWRITAH